MNGELITATAGGEETPPLEAVIVPAGGEFAPRKPAPMGSLAPQVAPLDPVSAEIPPPRRALVPAGPPGGEIVTATKRRPWTHSRTAVLMVLLGAGPLGLPALWLSPAFTRWGKIVWTACFLLLTVVLPLVVCWYWLEVAIRPLLRAFETLAK